MLFKRSLALISAVLLSTSLLAGCGSKPVPSGEAGKKQGEIQNMNLTGLPIAKQKQTLKFATVRTAYHSKNFSDMEMVKYWEEQTNIHIDWDEIPQENAGDKIKMLFAANDLPDAFYAYSLQIAQGNVVNTFAKQGMILPLNDLIDKYAPVIKGILSDRKDIKSSLARMDGNIYSLPKVYESPWTTNPDNMMINKKWLEKLSLKVPATTDEFYNVLKAFKEKDPNGNGKQDEIPLSFINDGTDGQFTSVSLFGSFGVIDKQNKININNGKVLYVSADSRYKEALQYINKLYKEGLIDNEVFTHKQAQYVSKGNSLLYGAFITFLTEGVVPADKADDYAAVPPLKGPNGVQLWNYSPNNYPEYFCITSANKNPEMTIRLMDYLFTGDNNQNAMWGTEGKGWKRNPDGSIENLTTNPPEGLTINTFAHSMTPGNFAPVYMPSALLQKVIWPKPQTSKLQRLKVYEPYQQKENLPQNIQNLMDDAAIKELNQLETDLGSYAKQQEAKFIVDGVTDSQWNDHLKKLEALKYKRVLEIYQAAYDQYLKMSK